MRMQIIEQGPISLQNGVDSQRSMVVSQQLIRGAVEPHAVRRQILQVPWPSRPPASIQPLLEGRLKLKRRKPGGHNGALQVTCPSLPECP